MELEWSPLLVRGWSGGVATPECWSGTATTEMYRPLRRNGNEFRSGVVRAVPLHRSEWPMEIHPKGLGHGSRPGFRPEGLDIGNFFKRGPHDASFVDTEDG